MGVALLFTLCENKDVLRVFCLASNESFLHISL